MHILLVGARGLLGSEIQKVFAEWSECHLTSWSRKDHDISLPSVADAVRMLAPDIVINAAAWTDVDGAEKHVDAAYATNMLAAKYLAEGCLQSGAALVHISTNEVFAGDIGQIYREYDQARPLSIYARSKFAGEQSVMSTLPQFCIVRTAWLFSPLGNCFPNKILAAARKHGMLRVVDDEFGNPTYAPDVAEAVRQLIASERYQGIFHLVNEGSASRYSWTQCLMQNLEMEDVPLEPVSADEWPRAAKSPRHAVLKNSMAQALSIQLRPWQEALAAYCQELQLI